MQIRQASPEDAAVLADLATQLGYPSTPEQLAARLAALDGPDHAVLVAEDGDRVIRVIGWLHVLARHHLETDSFAEIGGLVVDESCRGQGIGRRLVDAAVDWVRQKGIGELRVRSNVVRADAHRFYEREGFVRKKTQAVFSRLLQLP